MPSAFLEPVAPPPLESLPRKKWTVCEIEELLSKGWYPGDGYELIDGELIDKKIGKNNPHVLATMWLQQWLIGVFGNAVIGSTLEARRAGTHAADVPTRTMSRTAAMKLQKSRGRHSQRRHIAGPGVLSR